MLPPQSQSVRPELRSVWPALLKEQEKWCFTQYVVLKKDLAGPSTSGAQPKISEQISFTSNPGALKLLLSVLGLPMSDTHAGPLGPMSRFSLALLLNFKATSYGGLSFPYRSVGLGVPSFGGKSFAFVMSLLPVSHHAWGIGS